MEKPTYKLVGAPCGQHGQYTFYKALRLSGNQEKILAIGDFFFVRVWQDSELVSIGELQLLWTDRVSDQTLVSLRLYFLPENTPEGRNGHGEDEVLAINDKVVVRAEDLLSWVCSGSGWRWGLRAVWRGDCAPPSDARHTLPLHHTKLDFSDVDREKGAMAIDEESPGVVVFSYPRYCRYRALLSRLAGTQEHWLRQALVAALGGYAAPTHNTRILYCKDTFEYPELEGHEFVCNQLAPRLKGRPRGRRRRRARSRSQSRSSRSPSRSRSRSSESDAPTPQKPLTPRRWSLRNGKTDDEEERRDPADKAEDKAFMRQLKAFYKTRNESFKMAASLKDLSLRALYEGVSARGGYAAVSRRRAWRAVHRALPRRPPASDVTKACYERFLLSYENHERRNSKHLENGKTDSDKAHDTIHTIEVADSPIREVDLTHSPVKKLRTPSPRGRESHLHSFDPSNILGLSEDNEVKDIVTNKQAAELNQEFLDSLEDKKDLKISVKPVEKLLDSSMVKSMAEHNSAVISELSLQYNMKAGDGVNKHEDDSMLKIHSDRTRVTESAPPVSNGVREADHSDQKHPQSRPGRSSLRSVRVKPAREGRPPPSNTTPPIPPLRPDSASSSPPVSSSTPLVATNFGINYPPHNQVTSTNQTHSDDEIVEVPYKPKTPEIIDLDEYPESPQTIKKKKLDILKERGLEVTEVTSIPNWNSAVQNLVPTPLVLNPTMQHQIMTQAQLFQMYNVMPSYANGVLPPKVIQGKSIFGSSGPEKTVYGNPKDPFMPPPHILQGTPVKPARNIQAPTPQDILDLTCKTTGVQKPAVEIVRVPNVPSPSKTNLAQNLSSKNYTLIDGKAVVGSNLEITLVSPKIQSPVKMRSSQKRSSNGKFVSVKTPTPPKEGHPKPYASPSPSGVHKERKPNIVVPNYQINSTRDDPSPTGSTGSRDSQSGMYQNNFINAYKGQNIAQMMEMQSKNQVPLSPFIDPMYMNALYSSIAGQMDQRQLALYRELMANQLRGYSGFLNMGVATPTTKN